MLGSPNIPRMTADNPTDFPYSPVQHEQDKDALRRYWTIAKGIQAVDGLETSEYLSTLSEENVAGVRSLAKTGELLRSYHQAQLEEFASDKSSLPKSTTQEADLVAHRITELLSKKAFLFAPSFLSDIHYYLFQDLEKEIYHPGEYKTIALQKQEEILNGDSVVYSDPSLIDAALRMAFDEEVGFEYGSSFDADKIERLGKFISRLWQVHPFFEGNTRTTAVFVVLYLNDLGYDITNEPFERDSAYFRQALVRANYRNPKANAFPDHSFLEMFLENVLAGGANELVDEDLRVETLFEDPTLLRNVPSSQALHQT